MMRTNRAAQCSGRLFVVCIEFMYLFASTQSLYIVGALKPWEDFQGEFIHST